MHGRGSDTGRRSGGRVVAALLAAVLAVGVLATAGVAPAEDESGTGVARAAEESPWEFEFAPYAWIPGTFGTATVAGRSIAIDATVRDLLDLTTSGNAFAAGGYVAAQYDRWSFFVDSFGGYADENVNEQIPTQLCCSVAVQARAKLKEVIVDAALGYRIGQWRLPERRRPITLGVYAGMRYMHFSSDVSVRAGVAGGLQRAGAAFEVFNWADPLIGVRWEVPVFDRVSLDLRADIGGFGASSDLIWGLVAGARWWVPWERWGIQPWVGAGYRVVSFDRTSDTGNELNLEFRGPVGGMGVVY